MNVNKPADESPPAIPSSKALAVFDAYVAIGKANQTFALLPDGRAEVLVSRQNLADSMGWKSRGTPRNYVMALQSSGLIETCGEATVLDVDKRVALGTAAPRLRLVTTPKLQPMPTANDAETVAGNAGSLNHEVLTHAQVLFDTAAGLTETAASMRCDDSARVVLSHVSGVAAAASALVAIADQNRATQPRERAREEARDRRAEPVETGPERAEIAQSSRAHAPIFPPKGGRSIDQSIGSRENEPPPKSRAATTRTKAETIALVQPLHAAAIEAGGEGIVNEGGLHHLLSGLSDDQVGTGVAKLLSQIDAHGASIVGVLANRAKDPANCDAFWNDPVAEPKDDDLSLKGIVAEGRVHDGTRWVEQ